MKIFIARSVAANRGDLASQRGIVDGLLAIDAIEHIYVSSYYPHHLDVPGVTAVSPSMLKGYFITVEEAKLLSSVDAVLWGGGVDMQDSGSKIKLLFLLMRFSLLKLFNKSLIVTNQGAGPVKSSMGKKLAALVVGKLSSASMREPTAYHLVDSLRKNEIPPISQTVDAAMMLDINDGEFGCRYLEEKGFDIDKPILGLNIRRWFHQKGGWIPTSLYRGGGKHEIAGKLDVFVENICKALEAVKKYGYEQILLLPMYREQPEPWEDDWFLLAEVSRRIGPGFKTAMLHEDLDTHQIVSVMSRCKIIIGGRLHSTILSHVGGVPAVHIAYEHKGVEHFEFMKQEQYLVDINQLAAVDGHRKLVKAVELLDQNHEFEKEHIKTSVKSLKSRAISTLDQTINNVVKGRSLGDK